MKQNKPKRYAVLLAAFLMLCPLTGCGSTEPPAADPKDSVSDVSADPEESTETEPEDDESKPAETVAKTEKDSKESDKAKTTEKSKDGKTEKTTTAADSKNNKTGDKDTPAKTEAPKSNGKTTQTTAPNNKTNPTPATTAPADDDEDPEDEVKPTKYIYLEDTSAKYSGDGITVSGSTITISKGGTYEISGTLSNGQIYVETDKKKVKLHLNNASITNKAGSAINCQAAKKLTIYTLPGTVNYLEDGGTHDLDKGTIFSEDTVSVKGDGELNIKANFAHGIQSDDDIVINSGTVNISAAKSCLHSNDGIEINGGVLYCDGGTNGIKTDGYINIMGGSSVFIGGTREEKGAIYCDGSLTVTGGNFWAIGNTCTMPDASTTTANVIGMMFPSSQPAESLVNVSIGGSTLFTMTSPRNYKYVVYAGPDLLTNGEYAVSYGGTADGGSFDKYIYRGGSYSGGTDGGTFTADNTVKIYTVQ
jgi:hypothetical protein